MATLDDQNQPLFFLSAKTAEELHRLMIINNRRFNKKFHYLNPIVFKGKLYVWFEIPESDRANNELSTKDDE